MYMYEHFKNIENLYGEKAYVQIPNGVFRNLSQAIETNISQISFAYVYLVTIAFMYKYAHYVDVDNGTYIQNNDIKQILGYGKTTKTIDKVIKKDGILEHLGLIASTKNYPVEVKYTKEKINSVSMREFVTIEMLNTNYPNYNIIKNIVKNRNYEIKEPVFLFEYDGDTGSLYNYNNTHRITIKEFLTFIYNQELNNIDFMLYAFFKYKCYGLKDNTKSLSLFKITSESGIGADSFYRHLNTLKKHGYVNVLHKSWSAVSNEKNEANEYCFNVIL